MKRPALVLVVNVVQALLGLSLASITIYLIILTRSRETLDEPDMGDAVRGLLIGAVVLGVPAVITLIGACGLWRVRFWGWVLSVATDIGMLGVLIYSIIDDREFDTELVALTASVVVPLVLLLLPPVRKVYWSVARSDTI